MWDGWAGMVGQKLRTQVDLELTLQGSMAWWAEICLSFPCPVLFLHLKRVVLPQTLL